MAAEQECAPVCGLDLHQRKTGYTGRNERDNKVASEGRRAELAEDGGATRPGTKGSPETYQEVLRRGRASGSRHHHRAARDSGFACKPAVNPGAFIASRVEFRSSSCRHADGNRCCRLRPVHQPPGNAGATPRTGTGERKELRKPTEAAWRGGTGMALHSFRRFPRPASGTAQLSARLRATGEWNGFVSNFENCGCIRAT